MIGNPQFIPSLCFDPNDKEAVVGALEGLNNDKDPWQFACDLAKKQYDEILAKDQAMTEYLGGKPRDTSISTGIIHVIYRGVGVVFEIVRDDPDFGKQGVAQISLVQDVGVRGNQRVHAKFWFGSSVVSRLLK